MHGLNFQKEWADPELGDNFAPEWNTLDNSINRASHEVKLNFCIFVCYQNQQVHACISGTIPSRGRTATKHQGQDGACRQRSVGKVCSLFKTLFVFISDLFSHRWGPNHAADPIVTRWKREEDGQVVSDAETGKQVDAFR